eukprot:206184-Rhodomonas_salina.4
MSFFQRSIWMDQKKVYTLEELKELANEYTERHDDEIADAYQEAKSTCLPFYVCQSAVVCATKAV